MAVFPQIERLFWFHDQVKNGRRPNAARLAQRFEISNKTAQRDIVRLRDRLLAPLEYDPAGKGYYYSDDHFELPYLPASQQEILCLLLARKVLSQSAQGFISREIGGLLDRLYAAVRETGLTPQNAEDAFSATWIGYTPALEIVFRQTAFALLKRQLIRFTYRSPATDKLTRRAAEPHHLQHYIGGRMAVDGGRARDLAQPLEYHRGPRRGGDRSADGNVRDMKARLLDAHQPAAGLAARTPGFQALHAVVDTGRLGNQFDEDQRIDLTGRTQRPLFFGHGAHRRLVVVQLHDLLHQQHAPAVGNQGFGGQGFGSRMVHRHKA